MKRSIAYDAGLFEADCAAADVGGAAVVCNGNIVCLGFSDGAATDGEHGAVFIFDDVICSTSCLERAALDLEHAIVI